MIWSELCTKAFFNSAKSIRILNFALCKWITKNVISWKNKRFARCPVFSFLWTYFGTECGKCFDYTETCFHVGILQQNTRTMQWHFKQGKHAWEFSKHFSHLFPQFLILCPLCKYLEIFFKIWSTYDGYERVLASWRSNFFRPID